ncbi:YadA C-terminal domain-containing protein [Proteus mirabilis]|uniref:YadA C-terminal domain-containing protein n=1 Tax=Proteus mirabilis TaxID=584 RepID=UPI000761D4DC|nr:YadA C-terminal domain-containing protein [Proteus mirabilis]MDM3690546.1 YadA-like family protein [Proteus mirabilis]MDW8538656.1 YadA-like family protein [Proteus mirabilis]WFC09511.1 YadA-like family protein [Proteus mirabilis]
MNYNKLFLISLSLIYSANVFSNTDSPSPNMGNSLESNQEINASDNNLDSKKKEYVERKVHSLLEKYSTPAFINKATNFRTYVQNLQPTRSSNDNQFLIAAPIFDEMIALSTKNSNSKDLTKQSSDELNLKEYSIEEQRNMVSYLEAESEKIRNLSKKVNSSYHKDDLERLDMAISDFIAFIQRNIDSDNKENSGVTIIRNNEIQESLFENILSMYPVKPSDLIEMDISYDDRLSDLYSRSTQTATDLADTRTDLGYAETNLANTREDLANTKTDLANTKTDLTNTKTDLTNTKTDLTNTRTDLASTKTDLANTRTELSQLGETVKQHGEDIEEQGKEITQVRQTADKNKKYVDKYLVNNFPINGESRNLINHLSSLYLENKSNRITINSLRNDFEHFKDETNNRFYKVEKRANQGIASVAAMSNLPFNDAATFSTAMGIGNYRNATAFAWGMQYRINENVKVKASTAWNDANNWVSAGGIGISW